MSGLTIFIVDDEQESINALRIKLERYCKNITIVGSTTNAEEVPGLLNSLEVDLLFTDVEMPGMDGFQLLNLLKHKDFDVIMVTAFSQYAIKAIKANAVDYLLKPVDITELKEAVDKVSERRSRPESSNHVASVENVNQQRKITLTSAKDIYYVPIEDILYIHGENNYSTFHLADQQKIVVSKTLKEYESTLPEQDFFRIHKSFLININHLHKINKGIELQAVMKDGKHIEVSTRRKTDFIKKMERFNLKK
ncbi:LytR/AlgR family response regulator transcription factor [Flavobacterium silvaticum]|uniref:Response regulator transcription factor n=1 Tax=Flavobacterium silvaticum TaxID=1852020 RepID=A0A972JHE6_9FLAO|nr:LytTR family DNA-binding domain-containing protein [Flavobacterium silvaticum]NMH27840.1 response regulator transcription factor [Flavobacterium silvaticum]